MGKKGKRGGKQTVGKYESYLAVFEDGREVMMPPECPGWKSHAEALEALAKDGFEDACYAAQFDPGLLCKEVESQLMNKQIRVQDVTHMVPKGPDGSHAVLTRISFDLDKESKNHPNRALVMLRTPENTPAYVGGTMYGFIANCGSREAARAELGKASAPSLIVFYHGQHMQLPTIVVQGSHKLAAKIVAGMIDRREEAFACAVCMESFLQVREGNRVGLVSFLATDCDHAFHPHCIMETFRAGGKDCPVCRAPLPVTWVPNGQRQRQPATPQNSDPFRQAHLLGIVEEDEPRDRGGFLNALADQVRAAAIADGLEGVPDEPPSLT